MINKVSEGSFVKKAAVAAGTAAVVGSAIYALKKGQLPDAFEGGKAKQIAAKMGNGYKQLGVAVADKAVKGFKFVKEKAQEAFGKIAAKVRPAAQEAGEAAQEVAQGAAEVL